MSGKKKGGERIVMNALKGVLYRSEIDNEYGLFLCFVVG
jgi:hypothetical protein